MKNLGVRIHENGPAKDVLSAQVDQGFAHVSEGALEKVLMMKKKEQPDGDEGDTDRKTALALACIAAIKPEMMAEDVAKRINLAFLEENPDCYATLQVDADTLSDVVDKGEAKKVAEYEVAVEKCKARKAVVMQTREKYLGKYFKKSAAPKYSAVQKKQPRWLPAQDKATTVGIWAWIKLHLPAEVHVQCDDYNGRWRVLAPTLEWRSISWTKRGHQKAALEVIHQAWKYHQDWIGVVPPINLDELAKSFDEDI